MPRGFDIPREEIEAGFEAEADRQLAAEGRAAAEAGKQLSDCPYDGATWEAHAWRVAFAKRRIEQRAAQSESEQ